MASLVGQDRLAEGDVQVLARPAGVLALQLAQFQVRGAELLRDALGLGFQRRGGLVVVGGHAGIHRKRQAHQRMAEQQALDLRQRQHADDLPCPLGIQVERGVAEDVADQALPGGAVEEGGLRAPEHEGVPPRRHGRVGRGQPPDLQGVHAQWARKMRSMRPQRKSCSSICRRSSMRPMFT